jgi:hypothetical protein
VRFKVLFVVLLEEELDLLGKEREELLRRLCAHQLFRDSNLGLGEMESGIAVELNGTDTKVRSTKVDGQIQALGTLVLMSRCVEDVRGASPFLCHLVHQ